MTRFDLSRKDTVCALATAPAPAAIAVVRVSGPDADAVRARVFRPRRPPQRPFVATLGDVLDASAERPEEAVVDEALCTAFPEGRSYTGEPSFELSLHGGPLRVRAALRSLLAAGCRLAEPGELTLRAVLNGRMDLSQAEAVHDLVMARSDEAARAALRSLKGGLARTLEPVRAALVDALAEIEARLDFPDEDLGEAAKDALLGRLQDAACSLDRLLASAALGERLMEGARVVLYGLPNAGKSTLLNALVGEERALVHETPGTTRDVLEAERIFDGVPAVLVDVAGVRHEGDIHPVEALGIARAREELARADLVLLVVDAAAPDAALRLTSLWADVGETNALAVLTKRDLAPKAPLPDGVLAVSAKTGDGIDALADAIANRLVGEKAPEASEVVLTRARQRREVEAARDALVAARGALDAGEVHEVVASELRAAGRSLDRLLGRRLDDDVMDAVFSRFCIGK